MKYLLIVKQGEVHVLKTFKVPLKAKKGATSKGWNERRADLCALGPSSAFLEQSMFSSISQPQAEAKDSPALAAKKKKKQAEEVETRGSTLVTSCCCEVGWLSKHIFNQLMKYGSKGMLSNGGGGGGDGSEQDDQSSGYEMMTSLKEWMLVYPSEVELKRLYYDNKVSAATSEASHMGGCFVDVRTALAGEKATAMRKASRRGIRRSWSLRSFLAYCLVFGSSL